MNSQTSLLVVGFKPCHDVQRNSQSRQIACRRRITIHKAKGRWLEHPSETIPSFPPFMANGHFSGNSLFKQNICGNGTGTDTMPKYRYRYRSHISCSVKVRHNIQWPILPWSRSRLSCLNGPKVDCFEVFTDIFRLAPTFLPKEICLIF